MHYPIENTASIVGFFSTHKINYDSAIFLIVSLLNWGMVTEIHPCLFRYDVTRASQLVTDGSVLANGGVIDNIIYEQIESSVWE